MPLRIAAKVDRADLEYHKRVVAPLIDGTRVIYEGEPAEDRKRAFLAGARALLFPVDWPEPCGLVMAEALARGTPVIAFPRGSVAERIEHGKTGFVVNPLKEAAQALRNVGALSRSECRAQFEARFTSGRMAREYEIVYAELVREYNAATRNSKEIAMKTVAEVMTRDVISIGSNDTIRQAAMMMADLKVGSLPVCDGQKLVGTVTDRDIAVRAVASGVEPVAPVIEIATRHVQCCREDDDLDAVKQKMARSRIRRVPVVDGENRLVGIVSLGDLSMADGDAGETLKAVSSPSRPDR